MISYGVQVKEEVVVPPASMVSKFTFNAESMSFEKVKNFTHELFDIGVISYLPRECQLAENELLGYGNPY